MKHLHLSKFRAHQLVAGLLTNNLITSCQELVSASGVPYTLWKVPPALNSRAALGVLVTLALEELAKAQKVANFFAQQGLDFPPDYSAYAGDALPRPWSLARHSGPAADWHALELARQTGLIPPDVPFSQEGARSLETALAQGRSNAPGSLTGSSGSAGSSSDPPPLELGFRPGGGSGAPPPPAIPHSPVPSPVSSDSSPCPDLAAESDSGPNVAGDSDSGSSSPVTPCPDLVDGSDAELD